MSYRALIATCVLVLTAALGGVSCHSSGVVLSLNPQAADVVDTDRDGIPDDVELSIGTDPNDYDTDHDGYPDHYETFGEGGLNTSMLGFINAQGSESLAGAMPDPKADGVHAALDPEEIGSSLHDTLLSEALSASSGPSDGSYSGSGTHKTAAYYKTMAECDADGPQHANALIDMDDDGDGVPTKLETNGWFYYETYPIDWTQESKDNQQANPALYTSWQDWSSDGDPFGDLQEASGVNLPQVSAPGNHPLVAAYPDLSFELVRFETTLIADIETEHSGGTETENTVEKESFVENKISVGVKGEFGWEPSPPVDLPKLGKTVAGISGAAVKPSVGYERTWGSSTTNTTSTTTSSEWRNAVMTNTDKAATLKLYVRLRNCGSVAALDPQLPLNIYVEGELLKSISMALPAGLTFIAQLPVSESQLLAIDSIQPSYSSNNGQIIFSPASDSDKLTVNVDELAAINGGADLEVTSLNPTTGKVYKLSQSGPNDDFDYSSCGDYSQYMSGIYNRTALIVLEDNSGHTTSQRIYAPTWGNTKVPANVTLYDAVRLCFTAYDPDTGHVQFMSTEGDNISVDNIWDWDLLLENTNKDGSNDFETFQSMAQNGFTYASDFPIHAGHTYIFRESRQQASEPVLNWADLKTTSTGTVQVTLSADDYYGVTSVNMVTAAGTTYELVRQSDLNQTPWNNVWGCTLPASYMLQPKDKFLIQGMQDAKYPSDNRLSTYSFDDINANIRYAALMGKWTTRSQTAVVAIPSYLYKTYWYWVANDKDYTYNEYSDTPVYACGLGAPIDFTLKSHIQGYMRRPDPVANPPLYSNTFTANGVLLTRSYDKVFMRRLPNKINGQAAKANDYIKYNTASYLEWAAWKDAKTDLTGEMCIRDFAGKPQEELPLFLQWYCPYHQTYGLITITSVQNHISESINQFNLRLSISGLYNVNYSVSAMTGVH